MNWKSICALSVVALCVCGCTKSPEQIEDDRRGILESVAADVTQAIKDKDVQTIVTAYELARLYPEVVAMWFLSAEELTALKVAPEFLGLRERYFLREKTIVVDQHKFGTLAGLFTKTDCFQQITYRDSRERVTVVRQGQSRVIKAEIGIVLTLKGVGSYKPMNDAQLSLITRDCRWLTSRGLSVAGEAPTAKLGKVTWGSLGSVIYTARGALFHIRCTVRVAADCPTGARWVALVLPGLSTVAEASSISPMLLYRNCLFGNSSLMPPAQMSDGLALAAARLDVRPAK